MKIRNKKLFVELVKPEPFPSSTEKRTELLKQEDAFHFSGGEVTESDLMPAFMKKEKPQVTKTQAIKPKDDNKPPEKEWTVMFYMDGDNDLESFVVDSFLNLEKVGSDDKVNLIAELGRVPQEKLAKLWGDKGWPYHPTGVDGDWSGVRRYYIKKDEPDPETDRQINSPMVQDLGDCNMSEGISLGDFLIWGMKNYPAKHYMAVLMDHGAGFYGAFSTDATGAGGIMKTPDIGKAFSISKTALGKKPDVIHMAACLMGGTEVAYELEDAGRYFVASEEIGTTKGFEYNPIVEQLKERVNRGEELTPKDLAVSIVEHFKDDPQAFVTHSAVDLAEMKNLKNAINTLSEKLIATKTPMGVIKNIIKQTQGFGNMAPMKPFTDMRDLLDFTEKIKDSPDIADEELKKAADQLIDVHNKAVVANVSGTYENIVSDKKYLKPDAAKTANLQEIEEPISKLGGPDRGNSILSKLKKEDILSDEIYLTPDGKKEREIVKLNEGNMVEIIEVERGKLDGHGLTIYLPDKAGNALKYDGPNLKVGFGYDQLALAKDTKWDEFIVKEASSDANEKEIKRGGQVSFNPQSDML